MEQYAFREPSSLAALGTGCVTFVAALAIDGVLLGGLLIRWASNDSAVFTLFPC